MNASFLHSVFVSIVTWNDAACLERCLESVLNQSVPVKVHILDNASADETTQIASHFGVQLTLSPQNLGFCRGHNLNLLEDRSEYCLLLNPDVVLEKDFLERLLGALDSAERIGMVGGKLIRSSQPGQAKWAKKGPILDSTGIYFTPTQRHFDRGGGEEDTGQYEKRQMVFGITGAAMLCRRTFLEDIRRGDEYLDEDFFAYREDADLAWRGQLLGWSALYEPTARGYHARQVLPGGRSRVHPLINYHSVKNRFLLRTKNMDRAVRRRCFPYMWLRDLGILAYLLTRERSSLSALAEVHRLRPKTLAKRKHLQTVRRAGEDELVRWFSFQPVSYDL